MDAGALLEYFAPLDSWLSEQNKGEACERCTSQARAMIIRQKIDIDCTENAGIVGAGFKPAPTKPIARRS